MVSGLSDRSLRARGSHTPPTGRAGAGAEVRAVPALPPVAPARPLLPFGVFRLLLIVSVYSARVLVVQLEALLAGRRLAVLRHRGGSKRLGRRRSERQARRDRAGAAAAPSSAAHPRAPESGARGPAHPPAPPTTAGPAPPARLRLPPVSAVPPASVGVGPAHVSSSPSAARPPLLSAPAHLGSHGSAQFACPLPPVSAGEMPWVSRSRFRLSRRGPAHPASPLRPNSADTAPPTLLAGSGPFSRRGPAHLGRREGSAGPALPLGSGALRCEHGGGARLASQARGRRGWGVACPGLRL